MSTNRMDAYPFPELGNKAKFKLAFLDYVPAQQAYHDDIERATENGYEPGEKIPMPCLYDAADMYFQAHATPDNSDGLNVNKLVEWFCKKY